MIHSQKPEEIILSAPVRKQHAKSGLIYDRILLLTDCALYSIKDGRQIQRRIPLTSIKGVTARSDGPNQFKILVANEHDYIFDSQHCEAIFAALKLACQDCNGQNLPFYTDSQDVVKAKNLR